MNQDKTQVDSYTEAEKLLNNSRKKIDEIDQDILELISRRTEMAKNVITAKKVLGKTIYDEEREKVVYENIKMKAIEKNINEDIIFQVMALLIKLSKDTQREIDNNF
ncbi:MAG: chorismate mutase [Methanobrevibacter sp.]|jgi:chorismate mutase|nr:chorismate mutase [Candidatus Methanovirga australis]